MVDVVEAALNIFFEIYGDDGRYENGTGSRQVRVFVRPPVGSIARFEVRAAELEAPGAGAVLRVRGRAYRIAKPPQPGQARGLIWQIEGQPL